MEFVPKKSTAVDLICTSNSNKEMNFLISQEFEIMKEKKEQRFE